MKKVQLSCSNEMRSVNYSREPEGPETLRAFQTMLQIRRSDSRSEGCDKPNDLVATLISDRTD